MKPEDCWGGHEKALRRFGVALARDDRTVRDDRAAATLVEPLIRQTLVALRNAAGVTRDPTEQREHLLAAFIQRYRRHIRLLRANDEDGEWALSSAPERPATLRAAIHRLPLELRETLLLVVVEGFAHSRAAATLEISLAQLAERLCAARLALGGSQPNRDAAPPWRHPAHLRLVK